MTRIYKLSHEDNSVTFELTDDEIKTEAAYRYSLFELEKHTQETITKTIEFILSREFELLSSIKKTDN